MSERFAPLFLRTAAFHVIPAGRDGARFGRSRIIFGSAENRGNAEATDHAFRLAPPKNGTVFRIIEYPPDSQRLAALQQQRANADDGSGHGAAFDRGSPRHPGFHKTSSVDYAIVLAGEIYALMDEGEVLLKQGDVLVQRGTNHAWSNRSDAPAYLAFVLVDAEPL